MKVSATNIDLAKCRVFSQLLLNPCMNETLPIVFPSFTTKIVATESHFFTIPLKGELLLSMNFLRLELEPRSDVVNTPRITAWLFHGGQHFSFTRICRGYRKGRKGNISVNVLLL